jgi:hypothetical protein
MEKKKLSGATVKRAVLGDFDYGFLCMVRRASMRLPQHLQQGPEADCSCTSPQPIATLTALAQHDFVWKHNALLLAARNSL